MGQVRLAVAGVKFIVSFYLHFFSLQFLSVMCSVRQVQITSSPCISPILLIQDDRVQTVQFSFQKVFLPNDTIFHPDLAPILLPACRSCGMLHSLESIEMSHNYFD